MNELERLEQLKAEAIANPPKKVKGPCKACKKKKPITELAPVEEAPYYPTTSEIKLAYIELINMKGVNEKAKPLISKVFKALFDNEFDFNCRSCVSKQSMVFYNYCKENKII